MANSAWFSRFTTLSSPPSPPLPRPSARPHIPRLCCTLCPLQIPWMVKLQCSWEEHRVKEDKKKTDRDYSAVKFVHICRQWLKWTHIKIYKNINSLFNDGHHFAVVYIKWTNEIIATRMIKSRYIFVKENLYQTTLKIRYRRWKLPNLITHGIGNSHKTTYKCLVFTNNRHQFIYFPFLIG